jgi:hypothetical protein
MTFKLEDIVSNIYKDNQERDAFDEKLTPAIYKVETIEDCVKYYDTEEQSYIRLAQIKHHSKGVTDSKYYDAVLWLYLNFLKFLQLKDKKKISYKAVIFQHDPNGEKDVKTVFDAALTSYENKRKKELEKIKKRVV